MRNNGISGRSRSRGKPLPRLSFSEKPQRIRRYLRHHYRDVAALAYLLLVYPQMTNASHLTPESPAMNWISALWLVISLAGVAATIIKLRSLDPEIKKYNLESEVRAPAQRFLAGFIALPLMITMPIFMVLGPAGFESWLGPTHMSIGVVIWILLLQFGRGKSKGMADQDKWLTHMATVVLVLFELHLYTIFLESLSMADEGFRISMRSMLIVLLPMTGLFFMLFLPATIGFYIKECVRHRSRAIALAMLWLKFVVYRFLPVYLLSYLEGRGLRLPWIF